jgi:hypothetical protein
VNEVSGVSSGLKEMIRRRPASSSLQLYSVRLEN